MVAGDDDTVARFRVAECKNENEANIFEDDDYDAAVAWN